MKVRYAKQSDIGFILGGLEDTRRHAGWLKRYTKATYSDKKDIREAIRERRIRVAEQGNKPIGFLNFSTDSEIMYFRERFLWIDLVYVRKMCRRKGVGSLLYKDLTRIARKKGLKKLVIDIFDANKKSIIFHKKRGFKPLYTIYKREI